MKRQSHFRRRDADWSGELDVDVVTSAFGDAPSGVTSSFHHHSTTTSGQSLLSDLGAFSSVTPASSGFGYSQKNFHISDGNLYSVLSPFQSRRSSNRPTFLRGHSCVTSTTTSSTNTASSHGATPSQHQSRPTTATPRRTGGESSNAASASATSRPTKLKFHHQPPPSSSPYSGGSSKSTSTGGAESATRHFKSRPVTTETRFESTSSATEEDKTGGASSGSWFDSRFSDPIFTERLHSGTGVDSLVSKRLKCQQHRRSASSTMETEEEIEQEESNRDSSSRYHHNHQQQRRRLFDERLGDWDSEEISMSTSKRSSSSSYRRRFSSSSSTTCTNPTDKWDMDSEETATYDHPLNLCMADHPPRKSFMSRRGRPEVDTDASTSSTTKLTVADSEDDEDGDLFPFGSGRGFRRDRKLNFASLFDELHSSVRHRRSNVESTLPSTSKERVPMTVDREVTKCKPKVEARDCMEEDMYSAPDVLDYNEPSVLDLSTKKRLSLGGGGGSSKGSSIGTQFGQKQSDRETAFHAAAAGRVPVIVQQSTSGYGMPANVAEMQDWKTTAGNIKRFPQMAEMFENLRLQDDMSAINRYQRYQVLRERLMETHPEMFVGWEERDRFPPPPRQQQQQPRHHQEFNEGPSTSAGKHPYNPENYGMTKENFQDCPKLHRPPSSPGNGQRPKSWDQSRPSYTQTSSSAAPSPACTITVTAGPELIPSPVGITKSESAGACLQSSGGYHHSTTGTTYSFPLTTSATFPVCPTTIDHHQQQQGGSENLPLHQTRSEVTIVGPQHQWLPYNNSQQLLPPQPPPPPPPQATVIRVAPSPDSPYSPGNYNAATIIEVKSRPPTPSTSGGRGVTKAKHPEMKIKTEIGGGIIGHSRYKTRHRSSSATTITKSSATHHHQVDGHQPASSQNQYSNDISICKFKLIKGANPVLEEKKSFFVPLPRASSAQQLYTSHQQISGMGDLCQQHVPRDSSCPPLTSGGATVFQHHPLKPTGIVKSASTGTAVASTKVKLLSQSSTAPTTSTANDAFRTFKIHVESQEEMGRKMAAAGGGGGAASGSGGAKRLRRRSRKALAREKLEATFREQGFLIKTQQVSSAEGAVYCKFRQLKKFTRYLFKSWKDYLPKDLDEMSAAEGTRPGVPNQPTMPGSFENNPLVLSPAAQSDPS